MLGDFIRDLRLKKKFSMYDLAKRIGCSPSYIGKLENGQSTISIETLEKLANVLGRREELFCFAQKIPPEIKKTIFTLDVIEFLQDLSTLPVEERQKLLQGE